MRNENYKCASELSVNVSELLVGMRRRVDKLSDALKDLQKDLSLASTALRVMGLEMHDACSDISEFEDED